jgi:DNA-3-methyladenine glycosylase
VNARQLLNQHSTVVAPLLLGSHLISTIDGERVVLRLTEVEAYGGVGEDPGSHAFRRQTPRNATMFGAPGLLYVYFTYGMHFCANVVCGPEEHASAVLLRAGEVVEGAGIARRRRPSARTDCELARGPARLTVALAITGNDDGVDLLSRGSHLRLRVRELGDPRDIDVSLRTGVSGPGAATPWRFFLKNEPTVSPYRKARVA